MKSDYQQKKEARIDAYKNLAAKNEQQSGLFYNRARQIQSFIPMGQPILVGHHSERRHRADIARIDNSMRKSIEAQDKAEYYTQKAITASHNTAISSDDENALPLLREKLSKLEEKQEYMKKVNAICRKENAEQLLAEMGVSANLRQEYLNPKYSYESKGFQHYELTNNNAKIKNTKDRISRLEKLETIEDKEITVNGVRIVGAASENRIQIFFDGKPSEECRKDLKSSGFRWAPSVGAWMRQYNNTSIYRAKEIATKYGN